jgi:hypothetical protein
MSSKQVQEVTTPTEPRIACNGSWDRAVAQQPTIGALSSKALGGTTYTRAGAPACTTFGGGGVHQFSLMASVMRRQLGARPPRTRTTFSCSASHQMYMYEQSSPVLAAPAALLTRQIYSRPPPKRPRLCQTASILGGRSPFHQSARSLPAAARRRRKLPRRESGAAWGDLSPACLRACRCCG